MSEKYIVLMCKDAVVGRLRNHTWEIERPDLVPKGLVIEVDPGSDPFFKNSAITQFQHWCAGRVLSISRHYAKKVLNALSLSQGQTDVEKAKIALAFRCVSLTDSYWVRFNDADDSQWKDISLRHNSLNKNISLIALTGASTTVTTKVEDPLNAEVSTLGSYAKGWFRYENSKLNLYKTYGPERDEVEREVYASMVIDCFNVYGNLKYEFADMDGVRCSRCGVLSTDDKAIVHAADMDKWCTKNGTDVVSYAKKYFPSQFAQLNVITYLVANSDVHGWNWGFFQSMDTGEILGLHDLYDHNNCFDRETMLDENANSLLENGKSLKEAAMYHIKRCDLRLLKRPTRKIFPSDLAYETFFTRCQQLGIQTDVGKNSDKLPPSSFFSDFKKK